MDGVERVSKLIDLSFSGFALGCELQTNLQKNFYRCSFKSPLPEYWAMMSLRDWSA
jgi:hypothetical protein